MTILLVKRRLLHLTAVSFLLACLFGCKKDKDLLYASEEVIEINNFIWENMLDLYLWTDLMPTNLDRRLEHDPVLYFNKLLYKTEDRWSIITKNAAELKSALEGIELTFGYQFKLFRLPDTDRIIGIMQFVLPDSPAARANIRRGDIFYKVDGIELNTNNYSSLLFRRLNYTLAFGEVQGNQVVDIGRTIALTAEVIQENPIHVNRIFEVEGQKIGYLMYNKFLSEFESGLDTTFAAFQSAMISDLILDLRYNPGGAATNATYLASLIAPQNVVAPAQVFTRYLYNENVTNYFLENGGEESPNLVSRFLDLENNLGLDRVYILVTSNTASASELVINGLKPYMDVILIGPENTSGKYAGSITVEDPAADHGWAMQPIVSKIANVTGESDYVDGFSPDYLTEDDLMNPLGVISEGMTAQALSLITGIPGPARIAHTESYQTLVSGGMLPVEERQKMWIDLAPLQ